jgi:hypothetical protein
LLAMILPLLVPEPVLSLDAAALHLQVQPSLHWTKAGSAKPVGPGCLPDEENSQDALKAILPDLEQLTVTFMTKCSEVGLNSVYHHNSLQSRRCKMPACSMWHSLPLVPQRLACPPPHLSSLEDAGTRGKKSAHFLMHLP